MDYADIGVIKDGKMLEIQLLGKDEQPIEILRIAKKDAQLLIQLLNQFTR